MKILKYIAEEIVPLSRKQNIVLLIIITCVFQFVLFYAPALADQAVEEAQAQENSLNSPINASQTPVIKAPAELIATSSSVTVASSTSKVVATTSPLKVIRTSKHVMTAYNSEVGQTDDDPCTTANGYNLCKNDKEDSIAANFLKFGTKVRIPELFGDRIFVVRDRMNARHATRVDVWMKHHDDAMKFGVKYATIEVLQ
jgi:3D (Asp-Asp-Asp) domain-containing protein